MEHRTPRSRLQKRSWRRLRILLVLSFVVCLVALTSIYARNLLSVKEIVITSYQKKETVRGLEPYYFEFLPFVSVEKLQKNLVELNPIIAKIEVTKVYPNRLNLNLKTVKPIVTIKVADEYVLLAVNGRILQKLKVKPSALTELVYYQQLFNEQIKIGELLGYKDLQIAIRFVDILGSFGYKVKRVDIDSFYMIRLELEDSREILVTTEKDIQKQEYQVGAILRQFKVDGTNFKRIDVRYDKPVMTK